MLLMYMFWRGESSEYLDRVRESLLFGCGAEVELDDGFAGDTDGLEVRENDLLLPRPLKVMFDELAGVGSG